MRIPLSEESMNIFLLLLETILASFWWTQCTLRQRLLRFKNKKTKNAVWSNFVSFLIHESVKRKFLSSELHLFMSYWVDKKRTMGLSPQQHGFLYGGIWTLLWKAALGLPRGRPRGGFYYWLFLQMLLGRDLFGDEVHKNLYDFSSWLGNIERLINKRALKLKRRTKSQWVLCPSHNSLTFLCTLKASQRIEE